MPAMDERLQANQRHWDECTPIHMRSRFYDVEGWLSEGRGPRRWEAEVLGDVRGLDLVHLQCHFGLDTLAWARAGAMVTGLDFSAPAVEAASDLAQRAGLADRARFVCADVNDAAAVLGRTYDIVYVSLGALCWLPSVERWASQVAALLAPGGRLYLHEVHPLAWAMSDDDVVIEHTWFEERDPFVDDAGETYTDGGSGLVNRRTYEWNHGLGETVTALLNHGLVLVSLVEHDWTVWPRFPWLVPADEGRWRLPEGRARFPLSFSLVARRPERPGRGPLAEPGGGRQAG